MIPVKIQSILANYVCMENPGQCKYTEDVVFVFSFEQTLQRTEEKRSSKWGLFQILPSTIMF